MDYNAEKLAELMGEFYPLCLGVNFDQNIYENIVKERVGLYDSYPDIDSLAREYVDISCMPDGLSTGKYYTDVDDFHFEMFLNVKSSNRMFIVFDGAITNLKEHDQPQFNRWSWCPVMDGIMLNIEDPMYYMFPNLKLGWFYGTDQLDLRNVLYKVISSYVQYFNISNNNLFFYSSSGGGTVAIHMASMFKGSSAITINPQLFLNEWEYATKFEKVTSTKLSDDYRLDIVKQIQSSPESTFIVAENVFSNDDCEQLQLLKKSMNIDPVYGLNEYGNLVLWLYSGRYYKPHNAQEDKRFYFSLLFLAKVKKQNLSVGPLRSLYMFITELWDQKWIYEEKYRNLSIAKNEKCYVLSDNLISRNKPSLNGYYHELKFEKSTRNYDHIRISTKLEKNKLYFVKIQEVKNLNGGNFSIAVYDFFLKEYLLEEIVDRDKDIEINFMTPEFNSDSDAYILLYNGKIGGTSGNELMFYDVEVRNSFI